MNTEENFQESNYESTLESICTKTTFIDNVENFVREENNDNAESALTKLDERYRKCKFMEMNLSSQQKDIKKKLPDITASLDMIKLLKGRKEKKEATNTYAMIGDSLFIKAIIPPIDKIILELGANVMVEYELQDAEELLKENFNAAIETLEILQKDLKNLRKQLITIEVNMARVYNWNVKRQEN